MDQPSYRVSCACYQSSAALRRGHGLRRAWDHQGRVGRSVIYEVTVWTNCVATHTHTTVFGMGVVGVAAPPQGPYEDDQWDAGGRLSNTDTNLAGAW